jgi:fermentation-respiration switch protein FrsA (DUF1100 family)
MARARTPGPAALRRIALYVASAYLTVVIMLSFLQRSMMYFPDREQAIEPAVAGLPVGRVHTVTSQSDDGLALRGWLVLADGQVAQDRAEVGRRLSEGRPCVLYFSGNAGNRRYRVPEFEVFTAAGCNVLVFDYRGYGENAGTPTETHLAADAHTAWRFATGELQVSPERILLFGESLGGGVAVRLAADLSAAGSPPGGIILRSTFSSMVDVAAYHYPWLPVRLVLIDRYLSQDRISVVTCPILQLHGQQDTIVPIRLGRRLFAAAPERSAGGVAKQWIELPHADHNDIPLVAEGPYRAAITRFVKVAAPQLNHE